MGREIGRFFCTKKKKKNIHRRRSLNSSSTKNSISCSCFWLARKWVSSASVFREIIVPLRSLCSFVIKNQKRMRQSQAAYEETRTEGWLFHLQWIHSEVHAQRNSSAENDDYALRLCLPLGWYFHFWRVVLKKCLWRLILNGDQRSETMRLSSSDKTKIEMIPVVLPVCSCETMKSTSA